MSKFDHDCRVIYAVTLLVAEMAAAVLRVRDPFSAAQLAVVPHFPVFRCCCVEAHLLPTQTIMYRASSALSAAAAAGRARAAATAAPLVQRRAAAALAQRLHIQQRSGQSTQANTQQAASSALCADECWVTVLPPRSQRSELAQ